ncbi:biotin--[acetyl-CoA-carboxylase] ligase [Massilia aurea]|jgi:BirA family transcriptional regulator, biotin operon repressor / biotin---[acetyl-CoA-carboxylase] ligase|uniref:biotin--[acetyl-CoA-carboxylase] ligase n=1 Tax=Massilia aurea TaxID=373040 RepID=UPI00216251FB|nr:biotin--[acetyl-CoA-carboxylase] ligase [Massilia aurea]MCS0708389.1 biotin--[acetyl-CoA-carboxylase] ligase [Massilia aurea]
MNAAAIAALSRAGVAVEVVAQTGSTNADLLARASTLAAPLLLIAEHQSAGRGRAGRSWLSSPEGSLTFSLAWRFDGGPQALLGLPLAVGVALADTLGTLGQQVQLKWPNDVLKDGDKLAGILIETQSAPGGGTWCVIGIGLNLLMPDEMEAQLGRSAAGMPWLARMDRDALMAALLDGLADCLREFTARGFAAFSARWNLRHAWQGETVVLLDGGVVRHEGRAAGVDDSGRLLLDTDEGRITVMAGDVSLRVKA